MNIRNTAFFSITIKFSNSENFRTNFYHELRLFILNVFLAYYLKYELAKCYGKGKRQLSQDYSEERIGEEVRGASKKLENRAT
jgi:hypothetical protein